jgi:outer membrane protein TolC
MPRLIVGETALARITQGEVEPLAASIKTGGVRSGAPSGSGPHAPTSSSSSTQAGAAPATGGSNRRVPIASSSSTATAGARAQKPSTSARPRSDEAVKPAADDQKIQVPSPAVIPPPSGEYPIDLATALRLADVANPTIGRARTMILEALALQLTARTLLVPSLNGGGNYHGHNGNLQRSSGRILNVSSQSLYIGAGARTLAAESMAIPGVMIFSPLTDAWFEPLAARQRLAGARFHARATENDILMDVAVLHLELLGNDAILEAQRLSETQAYDIVRVTRDYAITGQGRKADADRAESEWRYRRADVQKAEEELGVTAARLAARLNLDPSMRLHPAGGPLVPLDLIALDTPQEELIQVAIQNRPDLAARSAEIGELEAHKMQEIARPFLPIVWLGFSGGVFGGGSNLVPPLVGNFGGRTDFDVRLYWTLLNLGAGNVALIRQREAQVGQAVAERARMLNRARSEVSAALADAKAARNQIAVARREQATSHPGFHEDLARSRQNLGRVIEVMNSLNLLADARVNLIRSLVRYDQAQFRLWVALGSPPPLVGTSSPDQPPVPDYLKP